MTRPAWLLRCSRVASDAVRWALTILWFIVAGCQPFASPAPVQVQGELRHIRQLAGRWEGEFHNEEAGRVGRIFLDLQADSDTAYGTITFDRVVIINACTDMSRPQGASTIVVPVVLQIGALAAGRRGVGGWVMPYRDPDLACWMDTWFRGNLIRDTLQGIFFSRRTDIDSVRQGTWRATRRP